VVGPHCGRLKWDSLKPPPLSGCSGSCHSLDQHTVHPLGPEYITGAAPTTCVHARQLVYERAIRQRLKTDNGGGGTGQISREERRGT
jgi:hypothetical protein